jgi:hypothetical protein
MSRLRPGIVVSEENLKVQVAALRKALGADPDFIHTEFGRGYRFTGVVRLNPAAEAGRYSTPANLGVIDLIPAKMAAVAEVLLQSQLKSEAGNSAAFALQVPLHFRCRISLAKAGKCLNSNPVRAISPGRQRIFPAVKSPGPALLAQLCMRTPTRRSTGNSSSLIRRMLANACPTGMPLQCVRKIR